MVSVPGIPDPILLPPVTRFCTIMQGRKLERFDDIFDAGDTSLIFTPQSAQAARRRAAEIKGQLGGVLTATRWNRGQSIRIAFINGDPSLQRRVMEAEWTRYANLSFVPAPSLEQAHIRVKFTDNNASWSMVGTDALSNTRPDSQTVQFGWLTSESNDRDVYEVVLHEFGHALGLIHEHQQPAASIIPWNRNKVYAYYWYHYGWKPDAVDADVLSLYSASVTQFSEFDPLSIMIYAIPGELTDNKLVVDWNSNLSTTDKAFIRRVYPGR
jgi:hypothetical protein